MAFGSPECLPGAAPARTTIDSGKLVAFIRHLPKLTPEELKEMEQLDPKTDSERAEEQDEERFLNESKSPQMKMDMHHQKGEQK
jgi:hypothetical protein